MKRRRLTPKEKRFLARERVIRVATAGRDGAPHVVPVCHALDGNEIYFGTGRRARKARNIAQTRRVSLVADRYSENWPGLRGVSIAGRARLIASGPAFARARQLLYGKFPQYKHEAYALEPGESVIVRVTPVRVMSWGL